VEQQQQQVKGLWRAIMIGGASLDSVARGRIGMLAEVERDGKTSFILVVDVSKERIEFSSLSGALEHGVDVTAKIGKQEVTLRVLRKLDIGENVSSVNVTIIGIEANPRVAAR